MSNRCQPRDYTYDPGNLPSGLPSSFDATDLSASNLTWWFQCAADTCCEGDRILDLASTVLFVICGGCLVLNPAQTFCVKVNLLETADFAASCTGEAALNCCGGDGYSKQVDVCNLRSSDSLVFCVPKRRCGEAASATLTLTPIRNCDAQTLNVGMACNDDTELWESPTVGGIVPGWYRATVSMNNGNGKTRTAADRCIRITN